MLSKKKKFVKQEKKDFKDIFQRIIKRDFSGNTGQAIKNSSYQFSNNFVEKMGSFIFTVILARLLIPELFGHYHLILSTLAIFVALSEIGINQTLITLVSSYLAKKNSKKAKAQTIYLFKAKILFTFLSVFVLLIMSRFLAESFYQKPIFLGLIAGIFYIIFLQIFSFLKAVLFSSNSFKEVVHNGIVFQLMRVIVIPLIIIISLKYSFSNEMILFYIVLFLSLCYLVSSLLLWFFVLKKAPFIKEQKIPLNKKESKRTNNFLISTAAIALSGVFFANIDKVMLGRFVSGEFIGIYAAAISILGAIFPFLGFATISLLPVFSRMKKQNKEKAVKKSSRLIFIASSLATIFLIFSSSIVVRIIYGPAYMSSANLLRMLSIILIPMALSGIYQSYYLSNREPGKIARLLLLVTFLNIILNYFFITILIPRGELAAVYGAGIATIISKFVYLAGLFITKKQLSLQTRKSQTT